MTQRIALYGGSFNPIHHGHLIIARAVAERVGLDRVIFLPSARPPHKEAGALLDSGHREAMVRGAIEGEDGFAFDAHDLLQSGPTYTIDTVAHFSETLGPDVDLHWIIGADSLADLTSWHRAADLVDRCTLVTAARPGWDATVLDRLRPTLTEKQVDRLRRHALDTPRIDISATDIRARIRSGRSIRYLVPDSVRGYIESLGLYRDADGG